MPIPVSAECRKTGNAGGGILGKLQNKSEICGHTESWTSLQVFKLEKQLFQGTAYYRNSYLCEWYGL